MAITSLLILLKFLQPDLMKLTMLGVQFKLQHVPRVYIALWFFLLYTMGRYYQYYRHDGLALHLSGWELSWKATFTPRIKQLVIPEVDKNPGHMELIGEQTEHAIKVCSKNLRSINFFEYEYDTSIPDLNNSGHSIKVRLPKYKFVREWIKAIAHYLRNRPQFLDVKFPFYYAWFAIIYCSTGCWDGSILKLMGIVECVD